MRSHVGPGAWEGEERKERRSALTRREKRAVENVRTSKIVGHKVPEVEVTGVSGKREREVSGEHRDAQRKSDASSPIHS